MVGSRLTQRLGQRQRLLQTPSMQLSMRMMAARAFHIRRFITEAVEENPYIQANLPTWKSSAAGGVDLDGFAEDALRPQSLSAYVTGQINQVFIHADERYLAMQLVQYLSPYGWLDDDAEGALITLGYDHGFEDHLPARVLAGLQSLTPAGLFARDLKECLMLQLIDRGEDDAKTNLVLDHLDAIGDGTIGEATGLHDDDLARALQKIRRCNPKPGAAFIYDEGDIFTPDLMIASNSNGLNVSVNQENLPSVSVFENASADDDASKMLLADAKHQVSMLNAAIKNRAEMLLKAGGLLARLQHDFLVKGEAYIKPLTMIELAEQMSCHKSTISRLVAGKLIQTPRGMMEMSSFFASGIKQPHGGMVAGRAIKAKILSMDDDNHLSDAEITDQLQKDGIVIARRTVNKYRQKAKPS